MFKKQRTTTRLVMEAIERGEMEKVFELMDVERREEFKQWVKGFLSGYGTAVTGLLIAYIIAKKINKEVENTEG